MFLEVVYSTLKDIASGAGWRTKKTYNNGITPLREAFAFGYKDYPHRPNPASLLESLQIKKKDRHGIDPFSIAEGEAIIRAVHEEWEEAIGNFDEFRFFTGLRQSEQIALTISDYFPMLGKLRIHQAIVLGRDKDRTKTSTDRW